MKVLAALCLLLLIGCERPAPLENVISHGVKPSFLGASSSGDSLRFGLSWDKGTKATGYLVWVRAADSGWSGLPNDTAVTGQSLNFTAVKAAWDSATFLAVVRSTNQFGISKDSAWARWRMGRLPGAPDSIVVDSSLIVLRLIIAPHMVSLPENGTTLFCAFLAYQDGGIAEGTQDRPTCDSLYATVAGPLQAATPAQVAHFDSLCVSWSVTGGAFDAPACTPGLIGVPHFQQLASRQ